MSEDTTGFWRGFEDERGKRRLSYRRIETASGPPNGRLLKQASALQRPTLENCRAIAEAFGVPLETVLRRAGLLPEAGGERDLAELNEYARALSAQKRGMLLELARMMAFVEASTPGEGQRLRIIGLPELPRPIHSAADVDQFLDELSPEERRLLAQALRRE